MRNVLFPFKEARPAEVFEATTAAGVTMVLLLALGSVGGVVAMRLLRRGRSETEAQSEAEYEFDIDRCMIARYGHRGDWPPTYSTWIDPPPATPIDSRSSGHKYWSHCPQPA
ncbi:MAG: hypothetical protein V3U50_01935 [Acidimicrobiia bacterium]